MDKIWMKEKIQKCFLLIQSRPFIMLILLIVVMSTILRIITPGLLVLCSLATATYVALRTGEFLGFASRTGEFQVGHHRSKESSAALHMHVHPDCVYAFNTQAPPTASWKFRVVQLLRQVSRSSLVFVKMHVLSTTREEGLYVGGVENDMLRIATECITNNSRFSKLQGGGKNGSMDGADVRGNGESVVCANGSLDMFDADGKVQASCVNHLHDEVEVGDVPELEDCTTSSEEEEICKSILETSTHVTGSLNDIVVTDATLQPMNVSKAAVVCPSDDEHSIDKHQILPLEGCKQCKNKCRKDVDAKDFSNHGCACNTYRDRSKLEITDAELQKAASEFYTLEGDVLWSETDIKKQQSFSARAPVVPATCEFCKQEGKLSIASQTVSIFPSKACTGRKTYTRIPASSKVVYYVDAKRVEEESGSEESVRTSAEDVSEDVMIDQELRAIACRSGRGESSNYMSTAGSFRDYVGSFREFDTFWPDYDIRERKEGEFFIGCCDDHAKPCISHSRSRSKVLQTDPLLSKASLTREQEIMDVLWQEYNEDMRQKHNNLSKQQRDMTQKQRPKLGVEGSGSISEVLNEGSTAESFNALQGDYVMKLNGMADHGAHERHNANSCRFGCDKPCWAKARGYQRRRHFVGFCRLFRELGLKQCMQSSKVDN